MSRPFLATLWILLSVPFAVTSGEGNIHLLEEEIAEALKNCQDEQNAPSRVKRNEDNNFGNAKIDSNGLNSAVMDVDYEHQRRNTEIRNTFNSTGTTPVNNWALSGKYPENYGRSNTITPDVKIRQRIKREDVLGSKKIEDECLSQCVFANMQVVDARGIPREPELWSRVQASVTSQQSRAVLRDQLRACFQELESEIEDDGCSYSNKLERCLTLGLSDRVRAGSNNTSQP